MMINAAIYDNRYGLPAVLEVTDAYGGLRIPVNDIMMCLEVDRAPKGYIYRLPQLYPADSVLRYVPEAALRETHYDLDGLERKLVFFRVTDPKELVFLAYTTDYGRKDNPCYIWMDKVLANMQKEVPDPQEEHFAIARQSLIDKALRTYKKHYTDSPEVRKAQRKQQADEDKSLSLEALEHKYNPKNFFVVLEVLDPAGFTRMSLTYIFLRMMAGEHVPGFVPNPYKEMHKCKFLRQVPEYCLTGGYDLKRLWALLKVNKLEIKEQDTLLIAHACDWGRKDNPCMDTLTYLKRTVDKQNLWSPFAFLCGCFARHYKVIAGGKKTREQLKKNKK